MNPGYIRTQFNFYSMKAQIVLAIAVTSLFAASSTCFGQGALQILTEFENKKIDAIKEYIDANPKAQDLDTAYVIMERAHFTLGDMEPMLEILEKRYSLTEKGERADLDVTTEIARDYIEICVSLGQKARGKKFAQQVIADLSAHPAAEAISNFINNVSADLFLPVVGDELELSFEATNKKKVDLKDYKGKPVLIYFWATWAPPSLREIPDILGIEEQYGEKGFKVIGICLDEKIETMEEFATASAITWPQYFDGLGWQNELARKFGIKSVPSSFLVGKDGKISATNPRGSELEDKVKADLGIK